MRKKCLLATIALLTIFCSSAWADSYKVEKGDCLWSIGKHFGVSYEKIKRDNQIKGSTIYPGQLLTINKSAKQTAPMIESGARTKKIVSHSQQATFKRSLRAVEIYRPGMVGIRQKNYTKPGGNPTRMSNDRAFALILLSSEVQDKLNEAVRENRSEKSSIEPGDQFLMTSGTNSVMDGTFTYATGAMYARKYSFTHNGIEYDIRFSPWCRNWFRYPEREAPPQYSEPPQITKNVPDEPRTSQLPPVPEIPTEITVEFPAGGGGDSFEFIPPPEKHLAIEHEPITGAFWMENKLGDNLGGYGEYMAWLRKGQDYIFENGWSPGIGFYGIYSEFDSGVGSYQGREGGIGPEAGIKYIGYGATPFNFQLKGRLVWEEMSGGTSEGYHMDQHGLKWGAYIEPTKRINKNFLVGIIGEGWWDIYSYRNSTWIGDTPSERGMFSLDIFGQWDMNKDWGFRASVGIFNQQWDDLTGIHAKLEARWKKTVMFGPYAAWFPFGLSSVYDGFSASDLTSYGSFARVEFGEPIRQHYANKRIKGVKVADRQWLDDLVRTKFAK